jgi:hypothetical protein
VEMMVEASGDLEVIAAMGDAAVAAPTTAVLVSRVAV